MKDWTPNCPPFESQYSASTHTDAQNCVSESFCHIAYMLTGVRYSPRALANMAQTTPEGNTVTKVLQSANTLGLIPYESWPTPDSFTWDSYYAPIPPEVLAAAHYPQFELIPANLDLSPLWTELQFTGALHMVAQINNNQYFDSEAGSPIKPLTEPVLYQTSLRLKPMNQAKVIKAIHTNTVFICYPVPDTDYLKKRVSLEGINPPQDYNNIPTADTLS